MDDFIGIRSIRLNRPASRHDNNAHPRRESETKWVLTLGENGATLVLGRLLQRGDGVTKKSGSATLAERYLYSAAREAARSKR